MEQIKKLRESTGVSMMACKKALEESNGDLEKAKDLLRKKGEAKAADRAGASTAQGAIVVKTEGNKSAMVELQCETDFVAKGDDFLVLADTLADKLLKGEISPGDKDLPEVKDAVLKLGENIKIGKMTVTKGETLGDYVHSNNKIGVVVSLKGGDAETAKNLAMHIAAMNPEVVSPDEVSDELVEKEKSIWTDQLRAEGKPEEIMEKIMLGKEKKFREENALVKQAFVKDPERLIEDILKDVDATVEDFVRFAI